MGPKVSSASRRRWPRGSCWRRASRRSSQLREYLGTYSCRPKRSPMKKMRSSRASLAKAAYPLLEALYGIPQPDDLLRKIAQLPRGNEHALLIDGVVGERVRQAAQGIRLPGGEGPCEG